MDFFRENRINRMHTFKYWFVYYWQVTSLLILHHTFSLCLYHLHFLVICLN